MSLEAAERQAVQSETETSGWHCATPYMVLFLATTYEDMLWDICAPAHTAERKLVTSLLVTAGEWPEQRVRVGCCRLEPLDDGDDECVGVASGVASSAARKNNTTMFGASRKEQGSEVTTTMHSFK
jgi:hypothetical protein